MPKTVPLTQALRAEYEQLFRSCIISDKHAAAVDKIVDVMKAQQKRYQSVGAKTGVPWYFIAAIHSLESSLRFTSHLHNGDPLTRRTTHVPVGRPKSGQAPFTWEYSAEDAMQLNELSKQDDWSLASLLYRLEHTTALAIGSITSMFSRPTYGVFPTSTKKESTYPTEDGLKLRFLSNAVLPSF